MKRKRIHPAVLVTAGAALLLACVGAWFFGTYTWVGGVCCRRDVQILDLSSVPAPQVEAFANLRSLKRVDLRGTGLTAVQYDQLKAQHPDCQILWEVPFQGGFLEETTAELTVSSLTDEDVEALRHLPELKTVHAEDCEDYVQLAQLRRSCPETTVEYAVPLNGEMWSSSIKHLVLENADSEELMQRLAWLPALEAVSLLGALPEPEQLKMLQQSYPEVAFSWCLELGDEKLETDTRTLELSGWKLDGEAALETLLAYGPGLEKLVVLESGLEHTQFLRVQEKHPELELVWDITIEGRPFRTDITEMDMSEIPLTDVSQVERFFPCFPKLAKVDMSHCGLSSETLDALNKKYPDIRIVWTISVSNKAELRTDATYFMPYKLQTMVNTETLKDLKYCTDLVCVDLGHMQVRNCEFVRTMPNLKYLILADTPLESVEPLRGHQNLIYLEIFLTRVTDYSPLVECPALLDLNISNNKGDLSPLAQMTWLERLWVCPLAETSHRNMPEILALKEALPNTQVEYSGYSTGMGWRKHPRYYEMRDILGMYYLE